MKILRKISCAVLTAVFICMCFGCREKTPEPVKPDVAVLFASKEDIEQNQSGMAIKSALEGEGYNVVLDYASNNTELQMSQIKKCIADKCRMLIIDAVDADKTGEAIAGAKAAGVCVISYDEVISDSENISYYVTFDDSKIGYLQGKYIADKLDLDNCPSNVTYNIEIFSGAMGEVYSKRNYDNAMAVLKPYFDAGVLNVPSGKVSYADTITVNFETEENDNTVLKRTKKLIEEYYDDERILDALLCVNDEIALDAAAAVEFNYNGTFPVITGSGCSLESIKSIVNKKQSMTVMMDYKALNEKTIELARAVMNNLPLPEPDAESLNNGFITAPVYLCEPVCVDFDNYKKQIVDSGYYTERQLE